MPKKDKHEHPPQDHRPIDHLPPSKVPKKVKKGHKWKDEKEMKGKPNRLLRLGKPIPSEYAKPVRSLVNGIQRGVNLLKAVFHPYLDETGVFRVERRLIRVLKTNRMGEPFDYAAFRGLIADCRRQANQIEMVVMPSRFNGVFVSALQGFRVEYE